jgi:type III secretion protein R
MALVVAAAYVRIAVVLAVLRSALGFGALPRSVTALLALVLALFVMMPVVERGARGMGAAATGDAKSDATLAALTEFLDHHTPEAERTTFTELARRIRPPDARAAVSGKSLDVLAPAFVIAELKAAFEIGFLLFLPFLVLELVVATLLSTLGMHSLDPRAVSLPFKLLLFVAADGWHLLARGLVLAYT